MSNDVDDVEYRIFVDSVIKSVRDGYATVRYAAAALGWTVDDVLMAAFGKIVL